MTSQENACRYCYGSARVRMKMMGFTDEMVDRIERNVQLVEAEPRERELVQFCRNLARSKPRPSRQAREQMQKVGFSRARRPRSWPSSSASVGFCNRVSDAAGGSARARHGGGGEKIKGIWHKLSAWLPGKKQGPKPPSGRLSAADLQGTVRQPGARARGFAGGRGARGDPEQRVHVRSVLPRRTLNLIFAVVAHALECQISERDAAEQLQVDGFAPGELAEVLETLASPRPTEMEALLIPWARDTVWMPEQPARIQARTRPLVDALGPEVLVEAVGAAALANGCVRLTMLQV